MGICYGNAKYFKLSQSRDVCGGATAEWLNVGRYLKIIEVTKFSEMCFTRCYIVWVCNKMLECAIHRARILRAVDPSSERDVSSKMRDIPSYPFLYDFWLEKVYFIHSNKYFKKPNL